MRICLLDCKNMNYICTSAVYKYLSWTFSSFLWRKVQFQTSAVIYLRKECGRHYTLSQHNGKKLCNYFDTKLHKWAGMKVCISNATYFWSKYPLWMEVFGIDGGCLTCLALAHCCPGWKDKTIQHTSWLLPLEDTDCSPHFSSSSCLLFTPEQACK